MTEDFNYQIQLNTLGTQVFHLFMNTGIFWSKIILHGYEEISPYFVLVRPEDSGEEIHYCKRIAGLRRAIENLHPGDEPEIKNKHRNAEGKSFKCNLPACVEIGNVHLSCG